VIKKRIALAIEMADKSVKSSLYIDRGKSSDITWQKPQKVDKKRLVEHLNITFKNLMKNDLDIFMLGEDILSPYGGAFKATKDISELYPNAIKNTPISEASIVGIGIGLGFLGFKPVVEIMFGDFYYSGF
jgi:transketolase C-terminal domain/subunit